MITFHIITVFPESMESYLATSVLGRAVKEGHIAVRFYNPRDYTDDSHQTVDDTSYGGGAGMVMKALPIAEAVAKARSAIGEGKRIKTILLSAKGEQYMQRHAVLFANNFDHIIIIAGRYEGIDERVISMTSAEELSVGPYVLTDGELPAMTLVSSVARLLPGVISFASLREESHWDERLRDEGAGALEYPHYTKPEVIIYKGHEYRVPEVLLSGNHKEIEVWRSKQRRGDLPKS
ncbi:tRNA (guanosine(37)-N1)-methyltransferase TrmD [Candidatus Wolfebacteria bacterium]|nr:tRNA (guanosine(37)-N1)-methyltransferase TrmD [Candidatus Wolfebacteria bacterium]